MLNRLFPRVYVLLLNLPSYNKFRFLEFSSLTIQDLGCSNSSKLINDFRPQKQKIFIQVFQQPDGKPALWGSVNLSLPPNILLF